MLPAYRRGVTGAGDAGPSTPPPAGAFRAAEAAGAARGLFLPSVGAGHRALRGPRS